MVLANIDRFEMLRQSSDQMLVPTLIDEKLLAVLRGNLEQKHTSKGHHAVDMMRDVRNGCLGVFVFQKQVDYGDRRLYCCGRIF
jgi:hypothetical protein